MEKLQQHQYQDIFRLRHGVLLHVNKWTAGRPGHLNAIDMKKKSVKVKGVSGFSVLTVEVTNYSRTFPAGSIIHYGYEIYPTDDITLWTTELKMSGGAYINSVLEMQRLLREINDILNSYYVQ